MMFATVWASHRPPRAVAIPRAFKAAAMGMGQDAPKTRPDRLGWTRRWPAAKKAAGGRLSHGVAQRRTLLPSGRVGSYSNGMITVRRSWGRDACNLVR